jgi:hypothetical protein
MPQRSWIVKVGKESGPWLWLPLLLRPVEKAGIYDLQFMNPINDASQTDQDHNEPEHT